ncbi:MAG: glycosyltransferase family 2 protein [Gammaproteobacteria bacterium]|nr:glycosyltransferase family 2 protein [Gammaproteobacteria bacterium]
MSNDPQSNGNIVPGLVSTIIPVYNRPVLLEETVNSVLGQSYRPIEIIIVDDGSEDKETPKLIEDFTRCRPDLIKAAIQDNQGPGAARETGRKIASGEFIQYLDSDDLLEPKKFQYQVEQLRKNPHCGVSYCVTKRPYCSTPDEPWLRTGQSFRRILPDFLINRGWATLSPLWRRTACDQIGPWKKFSVMEDWEYDCRAGLLGIDVIHCPEPLAVVRDHGASRASGLGRGFDRVITQDYFLAHESVFCLLKHYDIALGKEFSHLFGRKLFWIARMCARHDLVREARIAIEMAIEMLHPKTTFDIRLFKIGVSLFGWQTAARIAENSREKLQAIPFRFN